MKNVGGMKAKLKRQIKSGIERCFFRRLYENILLCAFFSKTVFAFHVKHLNVKNIFEVFIAIARAILNYKIIKKTQIDVAQIKIKLFHVELFSKI